MRSIIFKLLSDSLSEPNDEFTDSCRELVKEISTDIPELKKQADTLLDSLSKVDSKELILDYSQLFLGPYKILASPFSSVYLDADGLLMGESTSKVAEFYDKAGIQVAKDFQNPPDHIVAELEFYALLLKKEAEEGTDLWQELREQFFNDHLVLWVFKFTDKLKTHASTDFFKSLGSLIEDVIHSEVSLTPKRIGIESE